MSICVSKLSQAEIEGWRLQEIAEDNRFAFGYETTEFTKR